MMRTAIRSVGFLLALGLALPAAAQQKPQGLIPEVKAATARSAWTDADKLVADFRAAHGDTPEAIEAMSWLARGALGAKDYDRAEKYATETSKVALAALKTRPLDAEAHLPIALGAAIEVEAQVMAARGARTEAITYLQQQLATYRATSMRMRIQKNIHLLSLEGKPALPITAKEVLGPKMEPMKGRPTLLFFWAHWCPDCKWDAPIIGELAKDYKAAGLLVIGPTQRYGYVQRGAPAGPADELAYIDQVRKQYYGMIADMAVPVSNDDYNAYGVSTTPTIVIVDREGIVRLYHPGKMTRAELEPYIQQVTGRTQTTGSKGF